VNVVNAPEGERVEEGVRATGRLAGAMYVGGLFAGWGAPAGPPGVIGMGFVGGIIGSIGGEKAADGIISLVNAKPQPVFVQPSPASRMPKYNRDLYEFIQSQNGSNEVARQRRRLQGEFELRRAAGHVPE